MKPIMTVCELGLILTTIACGGAATRNSDQRSGHDANEPTKSVPGEPRMTQTALVGCLRAGEAPGSYTLIVTGDTPDRAGRGTSGSSVTGRPAPGASSTTGAGGDAVRNSPTIGGGATPLTYRLVVADAIADSARQQVDRQVSVAGVVEDNATAGGTGDAAANTPVAGAASPSSPRAETHTIRATAINTIADSCSR
jgi:hypothetical protein